MKKALCLLLCTLLLFSSLPLSALSEGATVTFNGEAVPLPNGGVLDISKSGSELVYAVIKSPDGTERISYDTALSLAEGDSVTAYYLTLSSHGAGQSRICSPLGLRFVTKMNASEWETIKMDSRVHTVSIGTLIVPASTLDQTGEFTHASLQGKQFLDIAASKRRFYDSNTATDSLFFAGSISNIKESHYNTDFCGVGYVKIVMTDNTERILYANSTDYGTTSIAKASMYQLLADGLRDVETEALTTFKNAFSGDISTLYREILEGLDVLCIGDDLFCAFEGMTEVSVWVNSLAELYNWNLTNLSVSGATVSYTAHNRETGGASLYDLVKNDPDYVFGSTKGSHMGTPSADPLDVDLILLGGGINDYAPEVAAPLGTVGAKTPETYLGAFSLVADLLLERYPNATLVFFSPFESVEQNRTDGVSAEDFASGISSLYKRYYVRNARIELIDCADPLVSGVDMTSDAFVSEYAIDRIHLNNKGMELMEENMKDPLWGAAAQNRVARTETERMQRDLSGLDVLALGDSLFYGSKGTFDDKVWINRIGVECRWNITNLGIGGATVSLTPANETVGKFSIYQALMNDPSFKYGSTQKTEYYNYGNTKKDPSEVDLIFLEGGSNDYDWKMEVPCGTVDSTDSGTFLGAWRLVTEELLRIYPNATVVFITAWENKNQNRTDGANAVEYTSSVCDLYQAHFSGNDRVKLINAGSPSVSGVDMKDDDFVSCYAYDRFHLNDTGMRLMADNMLPYIWQLLCEDR